MARILSSLICASVLVTSGVADTRAETALELLDRSQKELQAKEAEQRANAKPPKADAEEVVIRPDRDRYLLQRVNNIIQQARQSLQSGDDDSALQVLNQLQLGEGLPEELQNVLAGIATRLQAEQAERNAAFAKEVDAACGRAGDAVPKANLPKDLDATLQELNGLAEKRPSDRYNGRENRAANRIRSAITFVNRWQDYLLARGRSDGNAVANVLRNLSDGSNGEQTPLIPRSEILARIPQTDNESNNANPRSPRQPRPQAQLDVDASAVLATVKSIDDLPAALDKLIVLRQEVNSRGSYGVPSDSLLSAALTGLQTLQRNYLELRNGLATTINLGDNNRSSFVLFPELENTLVTLRAELVKKALPRLLGAGADEKAAGDEPLDALLRRLLEQAKSRNDWPMVMRALDVKRSLATAAANYNVSGNEQETAAFKSFLAGQNLETAQQYDQAVSSYLEALRSGQPILPTKFIGERLAAIEKAHPTEYAAGKERTLNPPMRSPYEGMSGGGPFGPRRGPMTDPRVFGGPGPTPVEDKLSVPAASPTPSPAATPTATPSASPTK